MSDTEYFPTNALVLPYISFDTLPTDTYSMKKSTAIGHKCNAQVPTILYIQWLEGSVKEGGDEIFMFKLSQSESKS